MALIDKASLLMVPSTYEAGTLYNVLPSGNRAPDSTDQNSGYDQTRADFTFDRGSNAAATRIGSDGLIKKYRENKLLQSNQFDTWSITSGSSVTSGQSGYDGSSDAWLLNDSGNNSAYCIYRGYTNTGVQTFSIYAKQASTSQLEFDFLGGSGGYLRVNLTDGSIHQNQSTIDYNIEDVGDGWYRCSFSSNHTSAPLLVRIGCNGAGSIYIQNAQVETGLVATDVLTSGATTAKAGVLIDLPRINYDANGENGALLLEPQRANLIQYSEYFGGWTLNSNGTGSDPVLDFGYTSPEGKDNAYKVTLDSGAGTTTSDESIMYLSKSGVTAGSEHTASVYLKGAVGGEEVIVRDTEGNYKKWTLTTEWTRYEYTQTASGSSYATSFGIRQGVVGTINSSAVVYIYGFQSELGSYKSSYIPNHGTSGGVTRAADSCTGAGSAESINSTEGVLYAEFAKTAVDSEEGGVYLTKDSSNEIRLSLATNNRINLYVGVGGVNVVYMDNTNYTLTDYNKIAIKYKENDYRVFINGTKVHTDTNASVPQGMNEIKFKTFVGNTKQVAVFNEALSDSELATLTTL